MRADKFKSLRCIEIPPKVQSPTKKGGQSQSLSPRKTKRIDKAREFRLVQ
jgi:hypothetical protein